MTLRYSAVLAAFAATLAGACSEDLSYDPVDPADPVEACMAVEDAFCDRQRECNNQVGGCAIESFRARCEQEVADLRCPETSGNQFLDCVDDYASWDCDSSVALGCPIACEPVAAPH